MYRLIKKIKTARMNSNLAQFCGDISTSIFVTDPDFSPIMGLARPANEPTPHKGGERSRYAFRRGPDHGGSVTDFQEE